MLAWLITIGNEILVGRILDTNSRWLARELTKIGYKVRRIIVIPDDEESIIEVFREALRRSDVIISTGGLGPTYDDITSYALSRSLNRKWVLNDTALKMVKERLKRFNLELNEYRIKMAKMPEEAVPLENEVGVAPGIFISKDNKLIFALPGVPNEMKYIFKKHVRKILLKHISREYYVEKKVTLIGYPESTLAPVIEKLVSKYPESYIKSHPRGVYENKPVVDVVVAVWGLSKEKALETAKKIIKEIRTDVDSLK